MASSSENISMAVFCDFENVALGVRDANYDKFDIKLVLERLLLKGSIVVKKAYCDWDRYKSFKGPMHEANFELIEIPHVRQSGKNSADIRLVVDALDLCYTKAHVDTFVIISGDSDFSPLVSKLRENAKRVIGVGVKQSTSDLLVANCDEFIFYDDLVREIRRAAAKRDERKAQPQPQPAPSQGRRPADEGNNRKREEMEARRLQALDMVCETFDALVSERGDTGKIWASLLKDTLKRRRPDFSESYYGFRTFGNLLEEAQTRGLFEFGRDEKSGTYVFRSAGAQADLARVESMNVAADPETMQSAEADADDETSAPAPIEQAEAAPAGPAGSGGREPRRRGGRGRKSRDAQGPAAVPPADAQPVEQQADAQFDAQSDEDADDVDGNVWPAPTPDLAEEAPDFDEQPPAQEAVAVEVAAPVKERRRAARAPRKPAARKGAAAALEPVEPVEPVEVEEAAPAPAPEPGTTATPDAVADDDSVIDADADADASADADTVETEVAAPAGRKPSGRPPRKPSTRAPRRPAKPKASSGNE